MAGLNDEGTNPALELLLNRRSHHRLTDPGPGDAELALILQAALRVPDFGRLRPFRFLAASGEGRNRLGQALHRAALAAGRPPRVVERAPRMPLRAPLVIVAVASPRADQTVPLFDQQLCAVSGFADTAIRAGASEVLRKARAALCHAGQAAAMASLAPLERLLAARRTPADDLLGAYRETGWMYHRGGQRAT